MNYENEKELNYETIKSMIYTIRGQKVMLDFDLAKLYDYETKRFNEQVKRNIDKFQKDSLFQLKNDENYTLWSQNATSNRGGSRYLPYAFTIDGIKVLSTVLRGDNIQSITSLILDSFKDDMIKLVTTEKWLSEANNYEIVKFESGNIMLDVRVSPNEDTIWLTQQEIAILFETSKQNISNHIIKIYEEKELEINSTVKDYLTVQIEGGRKINRTIRYYNLDVILSVGYRVNSKRGIEFRRWANSILKNYLIKGYSINTKRCLEHSDIINTLLKQVNELSNTSKRLDSIEKKVDIVMHYFNDPKTHRHYALFKGNRIESDVAYQTIYKLAQKSIYIIDDYIDIKTLQLLKCVKPNINIIIFSDNKGSNSLNQNYINDFIKDTGINIIIKQNKKTFHSRYIIIDYMTNNYQIYLCGGSSKDGGTSTNTIIELEEKEVYSILINKVLSYDKIKKF
ncbi:MAG: ORF6N domain-containing protein [Acholeplasmatales bacterium]|nr:ORF6N domain-containing protein [Acholeplasmatales bacterium]